MQCVHELEMEAFLHVDEVSTDNLDDESVNSHMHDDDEDELLNRYDDGLLNCRGDGLLHHPEENENCDHVRLSLNHVAQGFNSWCIITALLVIPIHMYCTYSCTHITFYCSYLRILAILQSLAHQSPLHEVYFYACS